MMGTNDSHNDHAFLALLLKTKYTTQKGIGTSDVTFLFQNKKTGPLKKEKEIWVTFASTRGHPPET